MPQYVTQQNSNSTDFLLHPRRTTPNPSSNQDISNKYMSNSDEVRSTFLEQQEQGLIAWGVLLAQDEIENGTNPKVTI